MRTMPMISTTAGAVPEVRTEKAPDQSSSLIGVALDGRYRITELVGAGGTSCLYKGFDRYRNLPVAVKVLHRHLITSKQSRQCFEEEARSGSLLSYPDVVRIIDQRVLSTGQPYVVMECAQRD